VDFVAFFLSILSFLLLLHHSSIIVGMLQNCLFPQKITVFEEKPERFVVLLEGSFVRSDTSPKQTNKQQEFIYITHRYNGSNIVFSTMITDQR